MSDNDLIRRGDARALFKSYDLLAQGSWLAPIMRGKADAIAALPAAPLDAPKHLTDALDAALNGYTPGVDRAVRFVSINQVDMLAAFYLNQRKGRG